MDSYSVLGHVSSTANITYDEAFYVAFGSMVFGLFILTVFSYIFVSFLLGRVFKKAGIQQWIAWVPVYNIWKTLEIGGQQPYWALIALIPFAGLVSLIFLYMAMYEIGKNLGKSGWFVLLAIFLPVVWMMWLGFDDSRWKKTGKKPSKAAFAKN